MKLPLYQRLIIIACGLFVCATAVQFALAGVQDRPAAVAQNHKLTGEEMNRFMESVLQDMDQIRVGTTRKSLLKLFDPAAGLRRISRTEVTYVYRKCNYIHLDVEFEPVGEPENKSYPRPQDKVSKLPSPYITRPVMD
jgi:hypothetical protein